MSEAIVEVRDYTIEAEWFEAYKEWATEHAVPWLRDHLDIIDFWVDDGHEPEVAGSDPQVSPHGQPNVCWIIRWPSRATREENFRSTMSSPEWQDVWAKHPNPNAYLHLNVRFMKAA